MSPKTDAWRSEDLVLLEPPLAFCVTKRATRPPSFQEPGSSQRFTRLLLDALQFTTRGAEEIRTPGLFRARDQDGVLGACALAAKTAPDLV
jgi:hypothetical protein